MRSVGDKFRIQCLDVTNLPEGTMECLEYGKIYDACFHSNSDFFCLYNKDTVYETFLGFYKVARFKKINEKD